MKEKLKVYHGIPKPPVMSDTLLYSSLDMTNNPTIGLMEGSVTTVVPSPYGYGAKDSTGVLTFHLSEPTDCFTLDLFVSKFSTVSSGNKIFLEFLTNSGERAFSIQAPSQTAHLSLVNVNNSGWHNVTKNGEDSFVRLCVTKSNIDVYINGVLTHSSSDYRFDRPISKLALTLRSTHIPCYVSHLCVTKGILGEYFPTLPQDFIDGKAIVVPTLNQRQSYGDPVLHQVTELLVPAQSETELGKYYSTSVRDADGYEQCIKHPYLYVGNWHNWAENYGKIRILGIDNTYITGVIDTDTAKCRVTKDIATNVTTGTFTVDDTSKLVVGDRLWIYSSNMDNIWELNTAYYLEVKSVNHTTKEVTATTNRSTGFKVTVGDCLIETTASSSLPVVKTIDGTVVNGTWSGIGTNQATFTLGSNSNIAGKDLVVTYCLNAKGNASPYPKMPSEVIRGYDELGNKLIPVSTIEIKDDYKNRILNSSLNTCPHKLKYALEPNLRKPNDHWNEWEQRYYNNLNTKTPVSIASPILNHHAQILVEIDLLSIVETKIGHKISGNVVDWLNSNIANIKCYATVLGNNDTNNNCSIKYFLPQSNTWGLNSGGATSNSSSFKTIIGQFSPEGKYLTSSKYYFLIHSDALSVQGNDSVKTRVQLQDIYFTLTFTNKSEYTYLFTKRNEARNGETCNPILVNKQTKEVKRLVPSTKPFSTEVLMYNPTTTSSHGNFICKSTEGLITTQGSGSVAPPDDIFRGLLGKMGLDESYLFTNDHVVSLQTGSTMGMPFRNCLRQGCYNSIYFNDISVGDMPTTPTNFAFVCPDLYVSGNELILVTRTSLFKNNVRNGYVFEGYRLPNRPLIK